MEQTDTKGKEIRTIEPKRGDVLKIRALITSGLISILLFLHWFIQPDHIGSMSLFWLLTFGLGFKIVKMCQEWYYYWSPSVTPRPEVKTPFTVDVLTTYCAGEPKDMIHRTLLAMKAIRYPHTNYLCDEADDPELKQFCEEHGIVHVTRKIKVNAKAGNINNALRQATGDICLVLDPDHVPFPEFIDRVIPYFENEEVGFVQCVQSYGNQAESFVALGAAQQTYHFYGPMMMTMNSYGTVQAIGANCTFRRKALDSIGGHAAGLAEDMHTAMQLHAKGWKSVYVPEVLARGLVPSSLSAYYKQQLKWSRGTFELLFRVYPKLFKNFTWQQRLHYFALPHYFLFGLVNLIDILVPILALVSASVPWEMDLVKFGLYFAPCCVLSLFIRTFAQRWVIEKSERGLHLAGGILRTATWWIFLLGFIYSIFNIKVPYIPTPKDDDRQNDVKLCVPNIIVIVLILSAVCYGLYIDWTPFSLSMGFYAGLVAGILGYVVVISQQKFLDDLKKTIHAIPFFETGERLINKFMRGGEEIAYRTVNNSVFAFPVILSVLFFSYTKLDDTPQSETPSQKDLGAFYIGERGTTTSAAGSNSNLDICDLTWNDTAGVFAQMEHARKLKHTPVIKWAIADNNNPDLNMDVLSKCYDGYLRNCASVFRKYHDPVFITFPLEKNHSEAFVKTWQYLYTFFNNLGISNLTWVWTPQSAEDGRFYPGEKFVDWIGVSCLNYATTKTAGDWNEFRDMYKLYRKHYGKYEKPVMIFELGCHQSALQSHWLKTAFKDIREKYPEVRAIVLHNYPKTLRLQNGNLYTADFTLTERSNQVLQEAMNDTYFKTTSLVVKQKALPTYKSAFVNGKPGQFTLKVNGKPIYIRGVAYNTAHDWRDGFMPLTRRQLERDFDRIKAMGANTIRRYDKSIYDRNILMIAEEKGLKVQYGFWFDPKVDYFHDTARVAEYINEAIEEVKLLKEKPAIIAWALGNETWGLLKHHFAKPYLTSVRRSYVKLIEQLAEEIHRIDPTRPIFTCIEHEEYQIAGELVAFHDEAPSLDVIGVNSYYKEQISQLNHVAWQFDSLRPYLVSEFGPRGYWDPHYNRTTEGALLEESDAEKADWYAQQWKKYIAPFKGHNIGGFAYCWHDRMEGSCTWFGLTDFRGRTKASYHALKALWTDQDPERMPSVSIDPFHSESASNEMVFTARVNGSDNQDLHMEWYLHKNEYLERLNDIKYIENGRSIVVKLPDSLRGYRLYLYASDDNGNVSTCSYPLSAAKKYMQ